MACKVSVVVVVAGGYGGDGVSWEATVTWR